MIAKHYYRIEELEFKFGISKSDVLYLVEQNKIRLAFYREASQYLIGGWLKNGFVAYGAVKYEGVVTIERDIGLKVFAKGKADTLNFQLCERDNINYLTGEYPFSIPLPNDYLFNWNAKSLDEIKWDRIPARIYPSEGESGMSMIADTIKTFAAIKSRGEKTEETDALVEKHYGKFPKRVLRGTSVVLNLSDACVLLSDIEGLVAMSTDKAVSTQNLKQDSQSKRLTKFDNDFDELLAKILQANKGIRQKEIMRILTEEARSEEDARKYDTRNILLDEVEGKIVWQDFGSTKQEKHYSSKTIANRLTEVRKLI
jgi:hypothetical protein